MNVQIFALLGYNSLIFLKGGFLSVDQWSFITMSYLNTSLRNFEWIRA